MSNIIQFSNLRLSFPKLIEAEAVANQPNSARKFGGDLIFKQGDPQWAKLMQAVSATAAEKWKEHGNSVLQIIGNDRKLRCFGSGTEKIDSKTFKPYTGYDGGATYLSASSIEDKPPFMVDQDGNQCPNENTMLRKQLARKLYGGCFVNVAVRLWAQDNQYGRGIRCELIAVQFAGDGEPFGEAPPDLTGMFGAVQAPAQSAQAPAFPGFPGQPTQAPAQAPAAPAPQHFFQAPPWAS
jgi:hypothetical protein